MRLETTRRSPLGRHLRGRQFRGGVPIEGTWLVGWIHDGRLRSIEARYTRLPGGPVPDPISRADAIAAATARDRLGPLLPPSAERILTPHGTKLVDVWRVTVLTSGSARRVDVATTSGAIVGIEDAAVYADTSATVFDPNPIVALRDNTLRQPGVDAFGVDADLDDARLAAALVRLPIRDVDPSAFAGGRLVGPNVDVQGPLGLTQTNAGFSFTRGDPRFETTMAYAHLDRLQRYLQTTLGLTNVNAEAQNVYAVPVPGFDNSFYMPGQDLILLGSGGVDDGEDAEVIVHEYGHAIHHDQVPGWGQTHEGGSMGEGFGDFLAAAFFARTSSRGFQDTCVADWDATSYSEDDPPCLRRLDVAKHYPEGMQGEVHADGEIWASFLWKLRGLLGSGATSKSDNALKLVISSHELLTPSANFKKGIDALKVASKELGHPEWVELIVQAARAYGLG